MKRTVCTWTCVALLTTTVHAQTPPVRPRLTPRERDTIGRPDRPARFPLTELGDAGIAAACRQILAAHNLPVGDACRQRDNGGEEHEGGVPDLGGHESSIPARTPGGLTGVVRGGHRVGGAGGAARQLIRLRIGDN